MIDIAPRLRHLAARPFPRARYDKRSAGDPGRRARPRRILIVDDEEQRLMLMRDQVRALGHLAETALDGSDALAKLALDIDLVLLDLDMPRQDGFELLRKLRVDERYRHLPVIVVTILDSRADRVRALQAGANDFIAKPVDQAELSVRLVSQLALREAQMALELQRAELEEQVDRRTAMLRESLRRAAEARRDAYDAQVETIRRLALAAELKDAGTAQHVVRLSLYSGILAQALHLSPHQMDVLRHAITMHDVGKIGIPDAILEKPGRLTAEERRVMESHTTIGGRILTASRSELLREGEAIAFSHHEHVDGTGYPQGLVGEQIPLGGRICAVVDVFDALTTPRPYRQALRPESALQWLLRGRGTQFDSALVDLFAADWEKVLRVHASLGDSPWQEEPRAGTVMFRPPPGRSRGAAAPPYCSSVPGSTAGR